MVIFGFLASLRGGLSVRDLDFNLPQKIHDLLRLVSLHQHDRTATRRILSHFTWYKNPRSGHAIQTRFIAPVMASIINSMIPIPRGMPTISKTQPAKTTPMMPALKSTKPS
jgi:hypothetical protein